MISSKSIENCVNRLIKASVEHSWAGTHPPEKADELEKNLQKAKKDFQRLMIELDEYNKQQPIER